MLNDPPFSLFCYRMRRNAVAAPIHAAVFAITDGDASLLCLHLTQAAVRDRGELLVISGALSEPLPVSNGRRVERRAAVAGKAGVELAA